MHSVMRSDFLNRFLSLDRFQRDSRLHVCAEAPPLPRFHSAPFRGSRFYTLFTGPNFGEQLTGCATARSTSASPSARVSNRGLSSSVPVSERCSAETILSLANRRATSSVALPRLDIVLVEGEPILSVVIPLHAAPLIAAPALALTFILMPFVVHL